MPALTVTSKGQVTLRKDVLQHLGIGPGEKLAVDKLPDGRVQLKAVPRSASITDAFGMLRRANGPVHSIKEINDAAAEGWARRR